MENQKKLFIGGLSYNTKAQALGDLFSQVGTVESADIIFDKMSGRSKGFGFVEMSTPEEAEAAIQKFNGTEFEGRNISVGLARPKTDRPARGGRF